MINIYHPEHHFTKDSFFIIQSDWLHLYLFYQKYSRLVLLARNLGQGRSLFDCQDKIYVGRFKIIGMVEREHFFSLDFVWNRMSFLLLDCLWEEIQLLCRTYIQVFMEIKIIIVVLILLRIIILDLIW